MYAILLFLNALICTVAGARILTGSTTNLELSLTCVVLTAFVGGVMLGRDHE